jgi:hypothetical protein
MPAPPPLSGFPRVNGKGQTLGRSGKVSHKKRPPGLGTIVTLSPKIAYEEQQDVAPSTAPTVPINLDSVPKEAVSENSNARKRARLSRQ